MSEPREHLFVPYCELQEGAELTDAFTIAKSYYLKSEADKVIVELKSDIADLLDDKKLTDAILDERNAEITELKAQKAQIEDDCAYWKMREGQAVNAILEAERACEYAAKLEQHQKYKRCLDRAKWCDERIARYSLQQEIQGISWKKEMEFYRRLRDKYVELAEKFKETK